MRFKADNIICKAGNILFNLNFQEQLLITGCMCPVTSSVYSKQAETVISVILQTLTHMIRHMDSPIHVREFTGPKISQILMK